MGSLSPKAVLGSSTCSCASAVVPKVMKPGPLATGGTKSVGPGVGVGSVDGGGGVMATGEGVKATVPIAMGEPLASGSVPTGDVAGVARGVAVALGGTGALRA